MKTFLSHLPESKQKELERAVKIIVETVGPEKIILFGSHATNTWVEDRYTENNIVYDYKSDYDLLVITKAGERKKDYEITDIIENRCRFRVPVNVITHDIEYVNKQLSEGQYFFTDIEKEGILLFDAGNVPLAERRELNPVEIHDRAQQDFIKWFNSSKEFSIDALNAINRTSFNNGAFYLHQAAERAYNAIILVYTGYKPKTHNLDKLYRLTKGFSVNLIKVFPRNTKYEEHLFDLLLKGYVDARYNDYYTITSEEITALFERVKNLQDVAETICRTKIASFLQE